MIIDIFLRLSQNVIFILVTITHSVWCLHWIRCRCLYKSKLTGWNKSDWLSFTRERLKSLKISERYDHLPWRITLPVQRPGNSCFQASWLRMEKTSTPPIWFFFTRAIVVIVTSGFCPRLFVEAICLRSVNATTRLVKLCKSLTGIRALCATEREEDRWGEGYEWHPGNAFPRRLCNPLP